MLGAVVEGVPAGLALTEDDLAVDLARRQRGYGRGARQAIEHDRARILSGVRHGRTLGSPILLEVDNRDWANWTRVMQVGPLSEEEAAELAALADGRQQARPADHPRPAGPRGPRRLAQVRLQRRPQRARALVRARDDGPGRRGRRRPGVPARARDRGLVVHRRGGRRGHRPGAGTRSRDEADASPLRCPDPDAEAAMIARIDEARSNGDTVGGVFEVVVHGAPIGLGSYVHWDRRLDAALAAAVMSINIVKGVEIGLGFEQTRRFGSQVHDVIEGRRDDGTWVHRTNNAGGLTGGITNGEPIVVRGAVKPISTLARPLPDGRPRDRRGGREGALRALGHLRRAGRGRHRRGDGDAHARPVRAREDRRRLDGRGGRQPAPVPGADRRGRRRRRRRATARAGTTGASDGGEAGSGGDD